MTNSIVTVNVSVQAAPTPTAPQKKGALISQGATTLAPGTPSFLSQLSDLTALLPNAKAISTITWAGNVATVTTVAAHGYPNGEQPELTIAGAAPAGYNGTFGCTITGASTFTYPLAVNPGNIVTPGTWTPEDVAELNEMATTFFAQGAAQGVYVLELGEGDPAAGVTALSAYITANQGPLGGPFYAYLVPRTWDAVASFLTLIGNFTSNTARTYFFVTTTLGTYTSYTAAMKSAVPMVEAPSIGASEFSLAAAFYVALNYSPGPTNKVTPFAFSFLFGVTPYPLAGNSATLAALKAANINYVGTGAEAQLSDLILYWGTTADGNDFTFWYSVDWVQFNLDSQTADAVINGSNNPVNPLYLNQDGVNRVQNVGASVMIQGIAAGLVLGTVVPTQLTSAQLQQNLDAGQYAGQTIVNAIPFLVYYGSGGAPDDFKIGKYAGLTVIYSPNRGFKSIVYQVLVTNFVAGAA